MKNKPLCSNGVHLKGTTNPKEHAQKIMETLVRPPTQKKKTTTTTTK